MRDKCIEEGEGREVELESQKTDLEKALHEVQGELRSLLANQGKMSAESETQLSELMERIRGKDLVIDANAAEMRQLKSTIKSQESSVQILKRKLAEQEELLEMERQDK